MITAESCHPERSEGSKTCQYNNPIFLHSTFYTIHLIRAGCGIITTKEIGDRGEGLAADHLVKKGFTVKSRNYHSRWGEIDIIAENGRYILFAEVKTRGANRLGTPAEAVDYRKQQKIIKTALTYLGENRTRLQPRFDVIEVIIDKNHTQIEHIENAFGV